MRSWHKLEIIASKEKATGKARGLRRTGSAGLRAAAPPAGLARVCARHARCRAAPYLPVNTPGRFSTKAAMPSFWSAEPNSEWNSRRS